jgi:hypothetical protein
MYNTLNEDLRKSFDEAIRAPSEDIARAILAKSGVFPGADDLQKSITTSTGLVGYDLQAPAKNLYPTLTPLRNRMPRVKGKTGTATNWKIVKSVNGGAGNGSPWVPEGSRGPSVSYTTDTGVASYVTFGAEDDVSFEGVSAAAGFEDVMATMGMRLMQRTMMMEEIAILGGNNSVTLAKPTTPTLSASGTGATLPGAPSTYYVSVVAMTMEGYKNSSLAVGIKTSTSVTPAGGIDSNYTLQLGSSVPSDAQTQAITLGEHLLCTVPAVDGAVAYAWFVGLTGAQKLEAITTVNSLKISAPLTGSARQTLATVAADSGDHSKNSIAFDGLLTTGMVSANGGYIKTFATGTAGVGTLLTSSGRGSVNEIDDMLQDRFDLYRVSPTVIYTSSQEAKNITNKVLSTGSAPLLNYFQDPKAGEYKIAAGGCIEYYYNPFAVDGGTKIPLKIHPDLPSGTIMAYTENLPAQYQSNNVPNVAEMHERDPYYQILWPITTRKRSTGVYCSAVLACYFPQGIGILRNIANG